MILWDPANPEAALYHARAVHARSEAWGRAVVLIVGAAGRAFRWLSGRWRRPTISVRRLKSPKPGTVASIVHRQGDCLAC